MSSRTTTGMMPCDEKIRLLQEALRQKDAQINRMISQRQSREPELINTLLPEISEKYKTVDPNIIIIFLETKVEELEQVIRTIQKIEPLSDAEVERFRNNNGGGS